MPAGRIARSLPVHVRVPARVIERAGNTSPYARRGRRRAAGDDPDPGSPGDPASQGAAASVSLV